MPDWSKSMQQTFEYYTVDPSTWKDVKRLENITSFSITRDSETATICSASISTIEGSKVKTHTQTISSTVWKYSDDMTPGMDLPQGSEIWSIYSISNNASPDSWVGSVITTIQGETIEITNSIIINTLPGIYNIKHPDTGKDYMLIATSDLDSTILGLPSGAVPPGTYVVRSSDGWGTAHVYSTSTITTTETETESLGECYVRAYLVTIQNGIRERHPLGTFLVQTPSYSFDGKVKEISVDAYSPLLELKESPPPIGYSLLEGENIMDMSYRLVREKARAPVVKATCPDTLQSDFVSNTDDTWLTFISDLILNAKYSFGLDELGRILFLPSQDTASLQPVKTFDDGNSSILYPELTMNHDLYGIPNVVEVVYSGGGEQFYSKVVNNDPNSPISTISRGREIVYRDTNPQISGIPSQSQIDEYAERLLRDLSTLEYTVSFTHGYYPIRLGDCVRLNYSRAGLTDVKAKVISQTIKCEPGCPVSTKAIFTNKLWR